MSSCGFCQHLVVVWKSGPLDFFSRTLRRPLSTLLEGVESKKKQDSPKHWKVNDPLG